MFFITREASQSLEIASNYQLDAHSHAQAGTRFDMERFDMRRSLFIFILLIAPMLCLSPVKATAQDQEAPSVAPTTVPAADAQPSGIHGSDLTT